MDATSGLSYRVKARGQQPTSVFLVNPSAESAQLWLFDGKRSFERYGLPP